MVSLVVPFYCPTAAQPPSCTVCRLLLDRTTRQAELSKDLIMCTHVIAHKARCVPNGLHLVHVDARIAYFVSGSA